MSTKAFGEHVHVMDHPLVAHKLTIMLFASMMKGIKYTRRSNTETTVYFIVHIGKDYGQEQMVNL